MPTRATPIWRHGAEDPDITPSRAARPRPPRSTPVCGETGRAGLLEALSLMSGGATTIVGGVERPASLPSAKARAALVALLGYQTIEELDAAQPNLKAIATDLLDWHAPKFTQATKSVVKAFGRALLAHDDNGTSLYPQAVEMMGFAAAASPLLSPDRLGRLIDTAGTVDSAFAPERYTMQLAAGKQTAFGGYAEARREELLISLWQQSHAGRWWDMTSGVTVVRTKSHAELGRAAREDAEEQLGEILADCDDPQEALVKALREGRLPANAATREIVQGLPDSPELREVITSLVTELVKGKPVEPDNVVHASTLRWLSPAERPEQPCTWLLRTLKECLGEAAADSDGWELPDKPRAFAELFPAASVVGFPHPRAVRELHNTPLPGIAAANVELVANAAALAANRDYMGNCTYSYKDRMESGSYALLAVWVGNDCYNAALLRTANGIYTPGEINSRFNHGNVPDAIRTAIAQLAAALPAQELPGRASAKDAKAYRG